MTRGDKAQGIFYGVLIIAGVTSLSIINGEWFYGPLFVLVIALIYVTIEGLSRLIKHIFDRRQK